MKSKFKNKKFNFKIFFIAATVITTFLIFIFSIYKSNSNNISPNSISGNLLLVGSSSMQEVIEDLSLEFMKKYPNTSVNVSGSGSSEAVLAVQNNVAQIGNLSRNLTKTENPQNFNCHVIAKDGIAVCLNNKNNIENISTKTLKDIFSGKIKNWAEIGGKNKKIILIGRDFASGTRKAFEDILNISGSCKYDVELESNGKVKFKIQNDEDAIGYISFSSIDRNIKPLKIDGITPSNSNILNSKYHLTHTLIQITKKGLNDDLIDAWFSFIYSEKGTLILKRNRFSPSKNII